MTRYYAVAGRWADGSYTLLVIRREDGHEVWGDGPLPAPRWADIPDAATARLQPPVPYRVVGEWSERDDAWIADAEIG